MSTGLDATGYGITLTLAREALAAYDADQPYDAGWRVIPHEDPDWWPSMAGVLSQSLRHLLAELEKRPWTMTNREIVRMNLTGLAPEMRERIKEAATAIVRNFDGAPEHVKDFNESRELLEIIAEVEAGP